MNKYLLIILFGITIQAQEFDEYVQNFEEYTGHKVDTKIEFGVYLSSRAAAVSIKGENHIVINKSKWDTFNSTIKYWIIYHELGHALLHMGHTKKGIMRKNIPAGMSLPHMFKRDRKQLKK